MVISFKRITKVNNNCIADMYFDKILVSTIQCTPAEFAEFVEAMDQDKTPVYLEPTMGEVQKKYG